jgi:hypothetical protein
MCKKQTLTRQELYELVWKTPMRRLASQFGVSDVALAKTCKRHNIPKPSLGYWAKKANGKVVRRPSLPPCNDSALAAVAIGGRSAPENANEGGEPPSLGSTFCDPELGRLAESESRGEHPIVVADSLRSPHPLVARTQEGFAASKRDRYQREPTLYPRMVGDLCCLEMRVGPNTIRRALRIMDALLKGLGERGYKVSVPNKQWQRGTFIDALGSRFQIRLREPTLRQKHIPNEKERESIKKDPYFHFVPAWDYVLSGQLLLELQHQYGSPICTIRDGKKRRVEDHLSKIPPAILRSVDDSKRRAAVEAEKARRRAEAEHRRREEEEKRQAEEKRRQEEQTRVDGLFAEAAQWDRCLQLRAYLEAVRGVINENHGPPESSSQLGQWLHWAEAVAEQYDPLASLKAEIDTAVCAVPQGDVDGISSPVTKPR